MSASVLQGGRRRRRSWKPLVGLGLLGLVAAALLAWHLWPSAGPGAVEPAAAKPKPKASPPATRAATHAPPPHLLAVGHPLEGGPNISARAGILVDRTTGTILWQKRSHLRLPIASTTKIMTAIVALQRLAPRQVVVVAPSATRVAPFREGLRPREHVPAWKLFYGLLLFSGNDDAVALAVAGAGSLPNFVRLMNAKSRALGLHDTHFRSASGLIDRGNYSTAWDLAALTRYAMWNRRFRRVVRTRVEHVAWAAPTYAKTYVNHNLLLGTYRGADGVKTGWTTKAQHCLVASAHRHGVRLIAVVLASPDPYGDARKLLNYGFASRG